MCLSDLAPYRAALLEARDVTTRCHGSCHYAEALRHERQIATRYLQLLAATITTPLLVVRTPHAGLLVTGRSARCLTSPLMAGLYEPVATGDLSAPGADGVSRTFHSTDGRRFRVGYSMDAQELVPVCEGRR